EGALRDTRGAGSVLAVVGAGEEEVRDVLEVDERELDGGPPARGSVSPDPWRPCSRARLRRAVPGAFGAWRAPDRVAHASSTARGTRWCLPACGNPIELARR